MEIYLIRHGIAAARGTYRDDERRPLTEIGQIKTTQVAQRLLSIGIKFDSILTSPLVRAYQTAEILQQVGLSSQIERHEPLKPNGELQQCLKYLQQWHLTHQDANLALVGHQPDLAHWAEILVWGSVKNQLTLKKAGIIGLQIPAVGTPIARSKLFVLTSPKWLI
ncbi:phosphohistidine phosphatase SixA [Myxosarcina sp. GI1(2024)]